MKRTSRTDNGNINSRKDKKRLRRGAVHSQAVSEVVGYQVACVRSLAARSATAQYCQEGSAFQQPQATVTITACEAFQLRLCPAVLQFLTQFSHQITSRSAYVQVACFLWLVVTCGVEKLARVWMSCCKYFTTPVEPDSCQRTLPPYALLPYRTAAPTGNWTLARYVVVAGTE